jgi:hypothetical protein
MIYALFHNKAFGASSVLCSGVSSVSLKFVGNVIDPCCNHVAITLLNLSPVLTNLCLHKKYFFFSFPLISSPSLLLLIFSPSCPACLLPLELAGNSSRPLDSLRGQRLLVSSLLSRAAPSRSCLMSALLSSSCSPPSPLLTTQLLPTGIPVLMILALVLGAALRMVLVPQ